jgi:hypothetical protein
MAVLSNKYEIGRYFMQGASVSSLPTLRCFIKNGVACIGPSNLSSGIDGIESRSHPWFVVLSVERCFVQPGQSKHRTKYTRFGLKMALPFHMQTFKLLRGLWLKHYALQLDIEVHCESFKRVNSSR